MQHGHEDDEEIEGGISLSQVWIGAPLTKYIVSDEDEGDAFFCKIGGVPSLFRAIGEAKEAHAITRCPSCEKSSPVRLLAQIYAPYKMLDRVFYVLQCEKCSSPQRAFAFAVRSVNVNCEMRKDAQTAAAVARAVAEADAQPMFEETDDWGDESPVAGAKDQHQQPVEVAAPHSDMAASDEQRTEYPVAPAGTLPMASKRGFLPCIGIEMFEEPCDARAGQKGKGGNKTFSVEDQLSEVERTNGADVVDRDSVEDDDETVAERCMRRYVERIGRYPSQCVRWCADGAPLLCRDDEMPSSPLPVCSSCGAASRFEFQILSTAIYFLTRGLKESDHTLHFGTVLVYSCSADCDALPYTREYCFVQSEV